MKLSSKNLKTALVFPFFGVVAVLFIHFSSGFHTPVLTTLTSFALGYLWSKLWLIVTCRALKLNGGQIVGRFHLHHSLFGLVAFLASLGLALFNSPMLAKPVFLFGLGIVLEHTLHDRKFVFISKI